MSDTRCIRLIPTALFSRPKQLRGLLGTIGRRRRQSPPWYDARPMRRDRFGSAWRNWRREPGLLQADAIWSRNEMCSGKSLGREARLAANDLARSNDHETTQTVLKAMQDGSGNKRGRCAWVYVALIAARGARIVGHEGADKQSQQRHSNKLKSHHHEHSELTISVLEILSCRAILRCAYV